MIINNKTVYRCVDWGSNKAEERFNKGKNRHDPYIVSMSIGTNGIYMNDEKLDLENDDRPCVFRGLGKSPHIHKCIEKGIPFMYIDTGYFGNGVKKKQWHRIAFNNLQTLNHRSFVEVNHILKDGLGMKNFKDIFHNRFPKIMGCSYDNFKIEKCIRGDKILVVPPSQKVFNHFGGDAKEYTDKLIEKIKTITDRKVEVREKVGRSERLNFTVQDQLRTGDYHCLVTFNSIASIESVLVGMPAIILGPNAGEKLSETKLENIEEPFYPDFNTIRDHIFYLSLCQFTSEEMQSVVTKRTIELLQGDQKPNNFKL
jgi:hypothetical protein